MLVKVMFWLMWAVQFVNIWRIVEGTSHSSEIRGYRPTVLWLLYFLSWIEVLAIFKYSKLLINFYVNRFLRMKRRANFTNALLQ